MDTRYVFTSLTRIAPLSEAPFDVEPLPRAQWATGDYVVGEIHKTPLGYRDIELTTGRMRQGFQGDLIVGALGLRHATLEATGTWEEVGDDGVMHLLTGAGLLGWLTSKSPFLPELLEMRYRGHVLLGGEKATMQRFVAPVPERPFETPVVLLVGTSMSAGKTTSARVIVRQLKQAGKRVLGAKLTGAGRLRDIQAMADAGADRVFDFVDVGLPSTVHPEDAYRAALRQLLSRMAAVEADVAVVEIGSSPLEPYNGAAAIEAIRHAIHVTVLCASDPYAAFGVMQAFHLYPSLVTGVATNTRAGIELIEKMCGVRALNLLNPRSLPELDDLLLRELESYLAVPVNWKD